MATKILQTFRFSTFYKLQFQVKQKNFVLPIKITKIRHMDMYGNSNDIKIKISIYDIKSNTFSKTKNDN